MFLSVVIAVRNRDENLALCLKSLLKQDLNEDLYEVIVINYGGNSRTEQVCNKIGIKNLTYIYIDETGIFNESRSKNFGIRNAKAEHILIINADIILPSNFLSRIEVKVRTFPKKYIAIVRRWELEKSVSVVLHDITMDPQKFATLGPQSACGDFQISNRQSWLDVQGYDERMAGWGAMDSDLVERMQLYGCTLQKLDPLEISIFHLPHRERAQMQHKINELLKSDRKTYKANNKDWGRVKDTNSSLIICSSKILKSIMSSKALDKFDLIEEDKYSQLTNSELQYQSYFEIFNLSPKLIDIITSAAFKSYMGLGCVYKSKLPIIRISRLSELLCVYYDVRIISLIKRMNIKQVGPSYFLDLVAYAHEFDITTKEVYV